LTNRKRKQNKNQKFAFIQKCIRRISFLSYDAVATVCCWDVAGGVWGSCFLSAITAFVVVVEDEDEFVGLVVEPFHVEFELVGVAGGFIGGGTGVEGFGIWVVVDEEGVGGELLEEFVVFLLPFDESPLAGGGKTVELVFGVVGPPVENIDGNCCGCCWGEEGKVVCSFLIWFGWNCCFWWRIDCRLGFADWDENWVGERYWLDPVVTEFGSYWVFSSRVMYLSSSSSISPPINDGSPTIITSYEINQSINRKTRIETIRFVLLLANSSCSASWSPMTIENKQYSLVIVSSLALASNNC